MAHSPGVKAQAVHDILSGKKTWKEVCESVPCSMSTLKGWVDQGKSTLAKTEVKPKSAGSHEQVQNTQKPEAKPKQNRSVSQVETEVNFSPNESADPIADLRHGLIALLSESVGMVRAWARTCSDPSFIKDNPSGVNELGKTVLERADRLGALVQSSNPDGSTGSTTTN
jgi:transposase-like protein